MGYKVVYFTRTGNSKRVAQKLAEKMSCELVEITDNKNWNGIFGFIKGGYYASKNKEVVIKTSKNVEPGDELILVSPIWAGGLVPAVKVFLNSVETHKIHLVVTSKANTVKNPEAFKSVTDIIQSRKNEDEVLEKFVNKLG